MKRKIGVSSVLFALLIGLSACNDDDLQAANNADEGEHQDSIEESDTEEPAVEEPESEESAAVESESGEGDEPEAESSRDEEETDEQTADWAEVEIVESEAGEEFTDIQLINDRGGSRVIHYFEEGQQPQYKSILVKNENRLKIISINEDGEGLIFNEIIDADS